MCCGWVVVCVVLVFCLCLCVMHYCDSTVLLLPPDTPGCQSFA